MRISLRTRLVLSFALVAVIPLAVTLLVASSLTADKFRQSSKNEIESLKEIIQKAFQGAGDEIDVKAGGAMHRYDLRELLFRFYDGRSDRSGVLSDLITLTSGVSEELGLDFFEIADGRGVILASAQKPGSYQEKDDELLRLIVREKDSKLPFLAAGRGGIIKGLAYLVVKPFEDLGEDVYLVAGNFIDESFLSDLPHTATTAIVISGGGQRQVLTQDTGVGRTVSRLLSDGDGGRVLPGYGEVQEIELGGTSYFAGAVPLPGVSITEPIFIHVLSSQENLKSVLKGLALTFLVLALAGCAFAWGLGYWFAGRITSPVRDLVAGLERVAQGRLDTEIPTTREDEIGMVISSFNRMAMDLKQLRESLLRTERIAAWQDIARRLAHEIKNPLSPIQLCIETVRKCYVNRMPEFGEILEESTQTILEEVAKLKAIVEEFSDFARLPKPHKTRESIHHILKQVLALYAGVRDSYEFKVEFGDGDPVLMVDPDQMNRVFINIIKNAMEAMPGGGTIHITTRTDRAGEVWRATIADSGPGIPSDLMDELFKPYFTRKPGGSGLGLAIAHRIVTEHAGHIAVRNLPEGGAAFTIDLPLQTARLR